MKINPPAAVLTAVITAAGLIHVALGVVSGEPVMWAVAVGYLALAVVGVVVTLRAH